MENNSIFVCYHHLIFNLSYLTKSIHITRRNQLPIGMLNWGCVEPYDWLGEFLGLFEVYELYVSKLTAIDLFI